MRRPVPFVLTAILAVCGCNPVAKQQGSTPAATTGPTIAADETITVVGTEPFWGGTIRAGQFTYSTPENQDGEAIAVKRFAGNNGLGFSGLLRGETVDMTVTPGACSDGMSDRSFPYTITLRIGSDQREGCAFTDRQPFTGPQHP